MPLDVCEVLRDICLSLLLSMHDCCLPLARAQTAGHLWRHVVRALSLATIGREGSGFPGRAAGVSAPPAQYLRQQ